MRPLRMLSSRCTGTTPHYQVRTKAGTLPTGRNTKETRMTGQQLRLLAFGEVPINTLCATATLVATKQVRLTLCHRR